MTRKLIALLALGLSAGCQVWIAHSDTALFYSIVFGAVAAYEFVVGELGQRRFARRAQGVANWFGPGQDLSRAES